jgi:hypothetical protein
MACAVGDTSSSQWATHRVVLAGLGGLGFLAAARCRASKARSRIGERWPDRWATGRCGERWRH